MKATEQANLTDNAWVERISELKQTVSDQYNPADSTPDEWVEWFVASAEAEYDEDDEQCLTNWAQRTYANWQAASNPWTN